MILCKLIVAIMTFCMSVGCINAINVDDFKRAMALMICNVFLMFVYIVFFCEK